MGVALYFVAWALVWPVLFIGYAKALLAVARFPTALRLPVGLLAYLAMAAAVFVPFTALSKVESWRTAMHEGWPFVVWFVIWFGLSLLPAMMLFQRRYLSQLKRAGYFKSR